MQTLATAYNFNKRSLHLDIQKRYKLLNFRKISGCERPGKLAEAGSGSSDSHIFAPETPTAPYNDE
jgi:hypothetical protein